MPAEEEAILDIGEKICSGAEYGYDSTTYEKFQQSGFPQTNVDPYFE